MPIFPSVTHISELALLHENDQKIWNYARDNNFCILTKDWDFNFMSTMLGCPPKVIHLKCGNKTTQQILSIILKREAVIKEFIEDTDTCYLDIGQGSNRFQ